MTGDATGVAAPPELADELAAASEERERVDEEIAAVGEEHVRAVADAHDRATTLLDRYVDTATGSGDFESFVEFTESFESLVEGLDDDLPEREAFERAGEILDQRRLSESHFERARDALAPAADVAALLEERAAARGRYRDARGDAVTRRDEVRERIERLERLQTLGEADLDAPVEDLREPLAAYDDAVREAFEEFLAAESARTVLRFVAATRQYPLVEFRPPPEDLREYVETRPAGTEPIPTLLEYAEYSNSKLDHYVDDATALKRAVATQQTYLRRLSAEPLTVGWPPPPADELLWRVRELRPVVARFAGDEAVARLREVAAAAREDRYARLREAAVARAELDDDERERLASGAVDAELSAARERLSAIADLLAEYPPL